MLYQFFPGRKEGTMGRRKRYDPKLVTVSALRELRSTWMAPGSAPALGTAYLYNVKDGNFDRLNDWVFSVQVPKDRHGDTVVSPLIVPGKKAWAGIARRSVLFVPATKHPYRRCLYCKINVADPSGERTKIGVRRGEKGILPKWFEEFSDDLRLKKTVTTTRGRDENAQVAVVPRDDHERMIQVFFALKVWVLQELVQIKN